MVTQEQANAIEDIERINYSNAVMVHGKHRWSTSERVALSNLTLDQFIRSLYIGYEVEQDIKEGDMLYHPFSNAIGEVEKNLVYWNDGVKNELEDVKAMFPDGGVRYATPEEIAKEKERRWWAKHDRNVWELKRGDLLLDETSGNFIEVWREDQGAVEFSVKQEGYRRISKIHIKNDCKIVCFVEARKDV